ncbi:recombinase family protein [Rhodococcus sp. W8901]|nr:recombinase family protein [Rhodococcus sp. W8901]QKT12164.1 recombinase family protein [Rhodococcus sp. W8901]
MDLGYARVSTTKQDLERQIVALTAAGIATDRIYVDRKSGATTDRPGLSALLKYARAGDVIVTHTLDRLGRNVRDTLNLIHDLREREIGVRNLADPIRIDSTNPDDPIGQLAVVLLALFAQMERTYTLERAAHARDVATAKGRRTGRPSVVTESQLAHAIQLRDSGATAAEIVAKTGLTRSTLYRHLPRRVAEQFPVVVGPPTPESSTKPPPLASTVAAAAGSPVADRLTCPTCGYRPSTRQDVTAHRDDLDTVWLHLDPPGEISERRHCVRCQPREQVVAVTCERCGDGPLVAGVGVSADGAMPAAVLRWLEGRQWSTAPELVCGRHGYQTDRWCRDRT